MENVSIPINIHIKTNKFSIYVNNKYFHHRIHHQIRMYSHENQARELLCSKYRWTSITFKDIDCFMPITTFFDKKITALRLIHHCFPTGNIQFSLHYDCPHYKVVVFNFTRHYHFFSCKSSQTQKISRLNKID